MDKFSTQVRAARKQLRPVSWSAWRAERVFSRIEGKRRRSTLSTVAMTSAVVATAIVVAIAWFAQGSRTSASTSPPGIHLADGTSAVALGDASKVRLVRQGEERVSFELAAGKGWFDVTPSATRRVEVLVQDLRVEVLGTEFVVEIQGEHVHVWVHRGRVRVVSQDAEVVLTVGQHQRFVARKSGPGDDPPEELDEAAQEDEFVPQQEPSPEAQPSNRKSRTPVRREAPSAPESEATQTLEVESVSELWKTADQARNHGDEKRALSALVTLVGEYPDDPRAALAAFTLGRMLMESEHSARTAARAFAKARKLAPQGPLVEDALFREINAWREYGDYDRARSRCKKYLRLFPRGRYFAQVQSLRSEL